MSGELGGDPPCWAHLVDDEHEPGGLPVVVDVGSRDTHGRDGAVWSLPHGGDLDANLVHLHAEGTIGEHVNNEVDVAISVISGRGQLIIDGQTHTLAVGIFALVPRGVLRAIRADAEGLTYLSIHRRRGALGIGAKPVDRHG